MSTGTADRSTATLGTEPESGTSRRERNQWWRNQAVLVWMLLLISFPLSRLASESFPSTSLVVNVLILGLFLAVVAFGQGLVILTGGIDLSVASQVALGAYITGALSAGGFPVVVAILAALLACAVVGAANGLMVSRLGFPAFIVTLAVGTILASVLLGMARGAPAQRSPDVLATLFRQETTFLAVPVAIWMFVAVALVGLLIQHRTTLGVRAYALGNSVPAARNARVDVQRATVGVYSVAGAAYGLAGVMLLGYASGADLNVGEPWLLPSIAAVVVGGAAIRGGTGSYGGTLAGALLLTLLGIDISATGLPEGYKQILYGAVIVLALIGARFATRRR
ncbi:ribose transport system permease protein [Mycobacterium frederiksbergense]|uniref:Ribose transport system permease protein n=1 Tax=Mycolicibacterium frederiksbergense TaxID=117567 RepID=A0ABT6L147_9MYCO|nr:ABC transporter permease [Mycolicibacterium frederiksbergense]MDH6196672.1 ribose transport system permease protein [Mycolicibacterium frederiksbergense]